MRALMGETGLEAGEEGSGFGGSPKPFQREEF
jgi:hypothetical protein